jgi:hypothetical protein
MIPGPGPHILQYVEPTEPTYLKECASSYPHARALYQQCPKPTALPLHPCHQGSNAPKAAATKGHVGRVT